MNTTANVCLVCGEGELEPRIGKNRVDYGGIARDIALQYSVCSACGTEQGDATQLRENKRCMIRFKKEVDELLSGADIRAIRKKLNLSQTDAARIFGGGPVAFSKYETDDVTQSEAMDKLLRVARDEPSAYAYLRNLAGLLPWQDEARAC